jgi:hypothetical protein
MRCVPVRGTTPVFSGCLVRIAKEITAVRVPVSAEDFLISRPVQTGPGIPETSAPIASGVLYQPWNDRSVMWATHLV